jgi:hypothetical protein
MLILINTYLMRHGFVFWIINSMSAVYIHHFLHCVADDSIINNKYVVAVNVFNKF